MAPDASSKHADHADQRAAPRAPYDRLRRYLPPDLHETLVEAPAAALAEAAAHVATTRATVTTYLPRLLIRQLLEQRRSSPWVEWASGSLLFADLSGSTALAERLSALGREGTERVTEFLNDIFASMIAVIQRHDGDLIAFGGDALLVFFGDAQHTQTATLAALALQEALHGYVKHVPGVGSFPMHLHIGVESGRVAFAAAGTAESLHYSALGSTVNGVAAAEGQAGPGEVVVGPLARARLGASLVGQEHPDGSAVVAGLSGAAPPQAAGQPGLAGGAPDQLVAALDDLDRMSAFIPDVLLTRIVADPQRPQIEAELRPVTVLFAQVIGLEVLAEQLDEARAAQAVQAYVGAMQEVIELYGGVVNKLDVADSGIKLLAIFGAPTAYEDHVERGARAALGMIARMGEVGRAIAAIAGPGGARVQQRVGLNLGTTFAGNVGSASRKEYTVMGDAVNVAARVMSVASWGEAWCSEAVARVIDARVECADRGSVALKGKAQPLRLFQVRGVRDASAIVLSDSGALVGRREELAWLGAQLDAALAGAGRAVRVVGDAGVGKSRLAAELLEQAQARHVRVIPAACFSYTASIPYAAWGEWLKALCGIASGDGDALRARKLADRLRAIEPGLEEWLPLLGDLVRLDVAETRLTRGLDPQLRQARRFDLLVRLLRGAAADGPVLTLFEDLHWADPISLDLWRQAAAAIGDLPILMLALHRVTPSLPHAGDGAAVLDLRELGPDESAELGAELASEYDLPPALVQQLVVRASGNPLFLAELLRAVAAHQSDPGAQPALSVEDLPDSLNGLLLSRIDRLDEVSRSILRVASVIGQRIPFGVLQSIQPNDQRLLLRQLARLDSEELTVLERIEPERVHAFRHALIQEVAYQSMLYARRRDLHGRIGEYLEQRYGADLDDYYGLLAHHFRLSDRREKAVHYLMRAGDAARSNYANEEAAQYYQWAIDALADEGDPRSWEAHDALADVYEVTGRYDDALAQHAAIIGAPAVTPDIARRAHRKRGSIHEKQGLYQLALEELDRAMTIATSGVAGISPLALPRTYADMAIVRQRMGEYDLAIAACEQGLAHLRHDDRTRWDELIEADLHSILGGTYGMRGDYPRAQHHFERSLAAREAAEDLRGITISNNNLGYLWQLQGDYERALTHYGIVEQLADKIHLRYMQFFANANAAYALICLGRYAEAEERCRVALQISREINAQQSTAHALTTLGIGYYQQGRYSEAIDAYEQARRANQDLGSQYDEANVATYIAHVYAALQRYQEARQTAEHVLERAEALQSQRLKSEALNALAEALLGLGQHREAAESAAAAAELAEQIGSRHDQGIALRNLGRARALQLAPFDEQFEQSIALLSTIAHRFELARTWAAYGHALAHAGNLRAGSTYLEQASAIFEQIGAAGELERLRREQ